ncbi:Adaptive-response sensory-kinase SasA [Candidatus Magnetaquicoccaceae bacterium FCR-1]|uniref:histidine kinase n=1 Tax=Candidatus Magnetaquiglobus chichijimensis TaxID=3141448 RepID=A0ABQ0C4J6_9PROT
MVQDFSFRRKIALFFLLILAAFAVTVTQSYLHYDTNQSSWQRDHLTRRISELMHGIENDIDHAHTEVEYFLRVKDPRVADHVERLMRDALPRLKELDRLQVIPEDNSRERVMTWLESQLDLFAAIRKRLGAIGFDASSGEHGRIREEIHEVEQLLTGHETSQLLASMLQLRRHEKDFMDRKQTVHLEKFHAEVDRFHELLSGSGGSLSETEKSRIRVLTVSYVQGFYTIVSEVLALAQQIDKFRLGVEETRKALDDLMDSLETIYQSHDYQQTELVTTQFWRSQFTVLAILLAIGLLMAGMLLDMMSAVNGLSATAQRVARGEALTIEVDRHDEIGILAHSLKTMQESLTTRNDELETTVRELRASERENRRALDLRTAISTILQLSLQPMTLEEILERALRVVLAVPWLKVEQRGAIFLYNRATERLDMAVHYDLSPQLLTTCASIGMGQCLCGRAASERRMVRSNQLDSRHEVRFEGMREHGHYCLPILSDQDLLGVLNVYLPAGHVFEEEESHFLTSIVNTLSGVIARHHAEENLSYLLATLDAKVVERTRELREKIEELETTRGELIASEKLASLGRLVAGIAHEVNTPIGVAYSGATQLLDESRVLTQLLARDEVEIDALLSGIEAIEGAARLVERNLARAAELVRSFKRASIDHSSEALRDYVVGEVVGDALMSLRNAFKKSTVEVMVVCPPELCVAGVPGYLNQILTNLLMNSLTHGFAEGARAGRIDITLALRGHLLSLTYADDGVGMTAEVREKAFEPFFTTNRSAGGSGLGLYICYNLVTTKLRGTIQLDSQPEQGVRITAAWPVAVKRG